MPSPLAVVPPYNVGGVPRYAATGQRISLVPEFPTKSWFRFDIRLTGP